MSFNNKIENKKPNKTTNNYIFVTGSIGVGKSTFIDLLQDRLKNMSPQLVKEFIDYDIQGEAKLDQHLNGEIGSFEFQKYIIDCYFNQFRNHHGKTLIVERHPMESLVFASQCLTKKEYADLQNYIINMCQVYEVPLIKECDQISIEHYDTEEAVYIASEAINSHDNLVIHLFVNEVEQIERIRGRNRESDQKYLVEEDMKYLRTINKKYKELRISFYDIDVVDEDSNVFVLKGFKKTYSKNML